jgi:hypothetical protein
MHVQRVTNNAWIAKLLRMAAAESRSSAKSSVNQ